MIIDLLTKLSNLNECARSAINMTPSENILSPLARLPFILDAYSRYFLDDLRLFGKWCFPGGKELGEIEQDILIPLLKTMTGASYVNVRPISGINCMTIALAALAKINDIILTVPVEVGGHPSTRVVAERLGLSVKHIPFQNTFDIDYERLEALLSQCKPRLIYIDQSTQLFPIDPYRIRQLVNAVSSDTIIHYDSSHINGLILGGALFNPLKNGAHSFGGSTHKTLPGPHKGFLATNDKEIAMKFLDTTDHFVSHHQMASVISLTITLIEMQECLGVDYAKQSISNAKQFAKSLSENDFIVSGKERDFSECHQVWAFPREHNKTELLSNKLSQLGIITNNFSALPAIKNNAFRFSLSEFTRMGGTEADVKNVAKIIADTLSCVNEKKNDGALRKRVKILREKINTPSFCYRLEDLKNAPLSEHLKKISNLLFV